MLPLALFVSGLALAKPTPPSLYSTLTFGQSLELRARRAQPEQQGHAASPVPSVPPQPSTSVDTSTAQPTDTDSEEHRASELFVLGDESYKSKQYEQAVHHFIEAYNLSAHPDTLYNIAMSLERGGDLTSAWRAYAELERTATTSAVLRDAKLGRTSLEKRLGWLEVYAQPNRRICVNGRVMDQSAPGEYGVVAPPGPYELIVDDKSVQLDLEAGVHRILHVDGPVQLSPPASHSSTRKVRRAQVFAVSSGALATVLAGTAFAQEPRSHGEQALRFSTLGASVISAAAASVAIISLRRHNKAERSRSLQQRAIAKTLQCPDHPDLVATKQSPGQSHEHSLQRPSIYYDDGRIQFSR